jgi:hypothetical protein
MHRGRSGLGHRAASAAFAALVVAAAGCDDPASIDEGPSQELMAAALLVGAYSLAEIGGSPLPYVTSSNPLCTHTIRAAALTLRIDGGRLVFESQRTARSDCPGPGPTLEFTSTGGGTWAVFGDSIRLFGSANNGQLQELARGRADGQSIALHGFVTASATAEEIYRRGTVSMNRSRGHGLAPGGHDSAHDVRRRGMMSTVHSP